MFEKDLDQPRYTGGHHGLPKLLSLRRPHGTRTRHSPPRQPQLRVPALRILRRALSSSNEPTVWPKGSTVGSLFPQTHRHRHEQPSRSDGRDKGERQTPRLPWKGDAGLCGGSPRRDGRYLVRAVRIRLGPLTITIGEEDPSSSSKLGGGSFPTHQEKRHG